MIELYSKQYKMLTLPSIGQRQEITSEEAKQFVKGLYAKVNYRPLLERKEHLRKAVELVKQFAECFQIDVDIIQTERDIQARLLCRYILGWNGSMKDDLCVLISMCDEVNVATDDEGNYDYILILRFMTHALYNGDRRVLPV